jgi:hypothetical protein
MKRRKIPLPIYLTLDNSCIRGPLVYSEEHSKDSALDLEHVSLHLDLSTRAWQESLRGELKDGAWASCGWTF